MVTLFVVLEYEYNKGERILGIFNSKEKAEDYIKQKSLYYYPDNKQTTLELRFDEWQLNKIRSRIN